MRAGGGEERASTAPGSIFFFSSRRRHTRYWRDWSSDVCSSDLIAFGCLESCSQKSRDKILQELLHRPKTGFSVPVREWLVPINEGQNRRIGNSSLPGDDHSSAQERGLRGWAKLVYTQFPGAFPLKKNRSRKRAAAPA